MLGDEAIAEVHAVDVNPAQLHLTALRSSAALALSPAQQRTLLGAGGDGVEPEARLALYREIGDTLPETTRRYWDAREAELGFGVNRSGRFEELFRELAAALAGANVDVTAHDAAAHPGFRASFQQVFERDKLARTFGEAAVAYSMDRSFADHFESVFASALRRWTPDANYFLHQVLRDGYPSGPGQLPPYLASDFARRAQQAGSERLSLHHESFAAQVGRLAREGQKYDVIQTSNISDWMPRPDLDALLAQVRRCLRPGGAVIGRRLNGDHVLADYVGRHFELDRALSSELRERDRSFFYREVVVGWA